MGDARDEHRAASANPWWRVWGWDRPHSDVHGAADCAGDHVVTIDDPIAAVGIALGNLPPARCAAADIGGNGSVTIDELVRAVRNALTGCASA